MQFMRTCVVKDIYTARYLYLCRLLSSLPKPGVIQSQLQEDKTRSVD